MKKIINKEHFFPNGTLCDTNLNIIELQQISILNGEKIWTYFCLERSGNALRGGNLRV